MLVVTLVTLITEKGDGEKAWRAQPWRSPQLLPHNPLQLCCGQHQNCRRSQVFVWLIHNCNPQPGQSRVSRTRTTTCPPRRGTWTWSQLWGILWSLLIIRAGQGGSSHFSLPRRFHYRRISLCFFIIWGEIDLEHSCLRVKTITKEFTVSKLMYFPLASG